MSLREDIVPYVQTSGLVSNVISTGQFRTCDNGPLFTSEYLVLVRKLGVMNLNDVANYDKAIRDCVGPDGQLHRAPGDSSLDGADDNYGAVAAYKSMDLTLPFKLPLRLWQPALAYARYPWLLLVLAPLAAVILGFSCYKTDKSDTTSRKLAYMLVQATQYSFLCKIGAWFFKRRLLRDYPNGMKDVYAAYFGADHPIAKYAVEF